MKEIQAILERLEREPAAPHALATLVSVEGSSYRGVGARLLVNEKGGSLGSISGGCLESDVVERSLAVLQCGRPQVVEYNTTDENDLVWGTGTGCNGIVRIFIERLPPNPTWVKTLRRNLAARQVTQLQVTWESSDAPSLGTKEATARPKRVGAKTKIFTDLVEPPVRLLIFGAGDDAQPLTNLARELGWQVEVADARAAYATPARFPAAHRVSVIQPSSAAAIAFDPWTVAVIMTHRYRDDVELLKTLLPRELPYLGLLGPRKRADKILAELASAKFKISAKLRAKLRAPVGLDLGGDGPEPIALAILSEIQAVLAARDARPLRERSRPIHT